MFGGGGRRSRGRKTEEREVPNIPINWRRLFGYVTPYKGRAVIIVISLLGYTGCSLIFPLVIAQLLKLLAPGSGVDPTDQINQLNSTALALGGLFFLQSALSFVQSFNLTFVGERVVLDLRTSLYSHLQPLSLDFYANRRVGELVSRISSDVTQVRALLTGNIVTGLGQIASLIGSVVIVFLLSPQLTFFILVVALLIVGVAGIFGTRLQKFSTRVQDALADATVAVEESLQGIRVVKSFTREDYEVKRYNNAMLITFRAVMRLAVLRSAFGALMGFMGFGALAAILWFSGREVIAGHMDISKIAAFVIYGVTIAASLGGLASLYGQIREAIGAVKRVFEILDTQPGILDAPNAKVLPAIKGAIKFENVTFSYDTRMTNIPGSSDYVLGGIVTYSNEMKMRFLKVKPETLEQFGAVSQECAYEMAMGIADAFGAELALSVTGIAGPGGGTRMKPVGLTYIGMRTPDGITVTKHLWDGDREANKAASADAALARLLGYLKSLNLR